MRQLKISKQITTRESKSITAYFNDINRYPLIDAQEEADLAVKIKKGDKQALQRLINGNLRFVVSVAKQYQKKGLNLEDLISEGNIGLITAAERFDHTKGFKFISYAVWWIRQSIMKSLGDNSRAIRIPQNQVQLQRRISNATIMFMQEKNRLPTDEEIAKIVEEPVDKVTFLNSNNFNGVSGDAVITEDSTATLFDFMSSSNVTDKNLIDESLNTDLNYLLDKLTDRQSYIIKCFFGIGVEAMSLIEIADDLGISQERVRQIKERVIKIMRVKGWDKILKDYV